MGGCLSLDEEEKKARQKSEAIDRMLEQEGREEENVVKILLLGKLDYQAIAQINQSININQSSYSSIN